MMIEAAPKQFALKDDGVIFFQPDKTNPLPGSPVAQIKKGEFFLQPDFDLIEGADLHGTAPEAARDVIGTWLKAHIYTVLEPLFTLVTDEMLPEPVKEIALKLFEKTGIVPRGDVEDSIAKLDPDMRKVLRDKKVRLGPLLIFLPDLNKPAAVHLRALLWCLHNSVPLPAPLPRDGAMSSVVDVTNANADYYRAIGYPLYGPRVIRIDMLDRVINAVYEGAKEGKFQAQHKMAEWMGCPIADLYAILEAMGHRHIPKSESETAEAPVLQEEQKNPEEISQALSAEFAEPLVLAEAVIPDIKIEGHAQTSFLDMMMAPADVPAEAVVAQPVETPAAPEKKPEQKKPELDWFFLRRGKIHSEARERKPFVRRARPEQAAKVGDNTAVLDEKGGRVKPFPQERYAPKGQPKERKSFQEGDERTKKTDRNKKFDGSKKKDHGEKRDHNPRVFTAEASAQDNPFAILQNLKVKS